MKMAGIIELYRSSMSSYYLFISLHVYAIQGERTACKGLFAVRTTHVNLKLGSRLEVEVGFNVLGFTCYKSDSRKILLFTF